MMRSSSLLFAIFFVLLAVYAIVVIKEPKLADATMKFSIILLLSMTVVGVVSMDSFSFTVLTIPIMLLTVATHYGTAALASFISFNMGLTNTRGVQSIVAMSMHDIMSARSGTEDPVAISSLALLNGVAEEVLFTGASYIIFHRFTKAKYVAAFLTAVVFALYHTQSYLGVSPFTYIMKIGEYSSGSMLLLSPFLTQLVKCGLSEQEAKLGGGLLGVSLGHALGNGLLLLASYGWL